MHKGIVRHIDSLGRIVIPKEMRRTMNISENDALEITETAEGLLIRKHSSLQHNLKTAEKLARALRAATGKPVAVCDRDNFVFTEGMSGLKGERISQKLRALIDTRKASDFSAGQLSLAEDGESSHSGFVSPVNLYGDFYGAVLLFGTGESPVSETDRKLCALSTEALSRLIGE